MGSTEAILDQLLRDLDEGVRRESRGDAIDEILSSDARTTAITSLRDHDAVVAFRRELTDGLIRVDTANRLLRLIQTVVTLVLSK